MTATVTTMDRPAYAVVMWSDDNWIYVELPCEPPDPPYICKFAFTEGGLSKALYALRTARNKVLKPSAAPKEPAPKGHIARITHPKLKVKKPVPETTAEQRSQALGILRKLKLLNK